MSESAARENKVAFSSAEWRVLLEDIGRVALLLGREWAVPLTAHPNRKNPDAATPLERLRLLETLWPQMETTLRALVACLDSRVQPASVALPLVRSRGGPQAAAEIARRPRPLTAWIAARQQDTETDRTAQVSEARPLITTNTPANRLLVTALADLEREATALATLAELCGEMEEAECARTLAIAIRRRRHHSALSGITPLSATERAALSESDLLLRCPPSYGQIFSLLRDFYSPLCLDWSDAALLRLPQRAPWQLYEIWCFLRVAACLRTAGWKPVEGDCLRVTPKGLRLALKTGRASRLRFARQGDSVELFYQPLFQSARSNLTPQPPSLLRSLRSQGKGSLIPLRERTGGEVERFVSRTHAMQPDIGLLYDKKFYLLDAKFRTYAEPEEVDSFGHSENALLEDVDKMHAYRDSIVDVIQAWCLFPGSAAEERTIVAYPQSTTVQPFGNAGIGAIRLRPGSNTIALERLLHYWFEEKRI